MYVNHDKIAREFFTYICKALMYIREKLCKNFIVTKKSFFEQDENLDVFLKSPIEAIKFY